jgi:hypothetical protein
VSPPRTITLLLVDLTPAEVEELLNALADAERILTGRARRERPRIGVHNRRAAAMVAVRRKVLQGRCRWEDHLDDEHR